MGGYGVVAIICGLLTLIFLPETMGRKIPQTIQDVDEDVESNSCFRHTAS